MEGLSGNARRAGSGGEVGDARRIARQATDRLAFGEKGVHQAAADQARGADYEQRRHGIRHYIVTTSLRAETPFS